MKIAAAGWRLKHLFALTEQLRFFIVIFSILAERSCWCVVCVGGIRSWNCYGHVTAHSALLFKIEEVF